MDTMIIALINGIPLLLAIPLLYKGLQQSA